ncbi:hypothetical protein L202_03243 [Cryptococcus amylolentus CBS 6039]|uniref:Protein kinase domain-containing protein n=1 Tax=Cryptococcus amylolentus CBS 6039 TaxID=1295533 RepID=A0A1E3I013_9TREE|nr:hypothetical protein L202_03243 [Cryptococcus amylolentus CBS 6039]ODN81151.1 hypothetical protein L202_03243 [Cryptococcus amylolentus CBS 6039]
MYWKKEMPSCPLLSSPFSLSWRKSSTSTNANVSTWPSTTSASLSSSWAAMSLMSRASSSAIPPLPRGTSGLRASSPTFCQVYDPRPRELRRLRCCWSTSLGRWRRRIASLLCLWRGLVLPVGKRTTSMWIDGDKEGLGDPPETSATGPTSEVPPPRGWTAGSSTTTTTTDTSQSGSTATGGTAFKMFPCPAVAADLHRLQGIDTTHHQSMHRLPYFRWLEDPTFRVQVSPPLTTDKSGAPPSSPIGPTSSMTAASAGFVVSTTEDKEPIRQEPEDLDDLRCKTDHQTVLSLLSRPDLLVELHEYLGSGRLWDAYRVKLSSGSTPSQVVVAKICNLYTFTLGDAYEYETPSAAADAIEIELDLLTHLQAVQGEIVPRLYGRWTGRCQLPSGGTVRLDCVMLEDCGRAIVPSDELETWLYDGDEVERFPTNLSSDVRQQIIESYEKLHKQGILHVDVNARHILLHPVDKKPRIIDFEGAISISEAQATNQDYDAEQEMERVRWLVRADEER